MSKLVELLIKVGVIERAQATLLWFIEDADKMIWNLIAAELPWPLPRQCDYKHHIITSTSTWFSFFEKEREDIILHVHRMVGTCNFRHFRDWLGSHENYPPYGTAFPWNHILPPKFCCTFKRPSQFCKHNTWNVFARYRATRWTLALTRGNKENKIIK